MSDKPQKPKLLLAEAQLSMIPADHMNYMIKFLADFAAAPNEGRPFQLNFFNVTGDQTARARNKIVEHALEKKMDWLLFIDTDMTIDYKSILSLYNVAVEKKLAVVSGLYFRRKNVPLPQILVKNDNNSDWHVMQDYPRNKLVECDGIGLGIALIDMRIFRHVLKKPWFDHEIYGDVVPTEDLSFCRKLRRKGERIYVDTRIKAGHIGDHNVDEAFWDVFNKVNPEFMKGWNDAMEEDRTKVEAKPEATKAERMKKLDAEIKKTAEGTIVKEPYPPGYPPAEVKPK